MGIVPKPVVCVKESYTSHVWWFGIQQYITVAAGGTTGRIGAVAPVAGGFLGVEQSALLWAQRRLGSEVHEPGKGPGGFGLGLGGASVQLDVLVRRRSLVPGCVESAYKDARVVDAPISVIRGSDAKTKEHAPNGIPKGNGDP